MVIKNNFNVVEYVSLVSGIASEFFGTDGEYVPHIGRLNAMRLFYNECVVESKFDLPHDFDDALQMDVLVEDEEFINEFNKAIKGDGIIRLDFANAYSEAMEIVRTNKDSFNNMVNAIKGVINKALEKIGSMVSDETVTKFKEIADRFSNGNISAESVVDAYIKSQKVKDTSENE